jgi:predicted ATPase/DNA-binding winged helix-turn-helix (wHTH) protein
MNEVGGKVFRFEGYALDLRRGCLRRDDREIELRPKCFAMLRYLVENAGRLVPKDELIQAVWPNVIVTDDSLTRCMSDIRRALQDDAQRIVKTVQRRGYLFAASVSTDEDTPPRLAAASDLGAAERLTNLPQRLAAVIGRETELAELPERIANNRLVTLTGTSGIGKTRLAVELGWRMMRDFAGGVWLIDLAPLSDPAVLSSAVATVLEVALSDADAPLDAIAAAVGKQPKLLIFDNCEHLIGAAAALIEGLLERAPMLSILATSQEVLGIAAEQIYRLNPLALPPPAAADIGGFGAVILFVERARAADRRFRLDRGNAAGVSEICRGLDGIPLILEMAASRLPLLGVEGLRGRLGERLHLLNTGPRTAETRHRTLRAMVAWSYGLLDPADQRVFRRLAAFAGSFSLEAAIAVAGEGPGDSWAILDALGRLIDKSLVTVEGEEKPRYRLLETLRLFAADALAANGEGEAIAERHARYFTDLFDLAYEAWETTPDAEWLELYQPEIDNVRAALDWAYREPSRAGIAIRLAGSAALFWGNLSLLPEGRRNAERAARLIDHTTQPGDAARLMRQVGALWFYADRLRALAALEQSAALYGQLEDWPHLGSVLGTMGGIYPYLGRHAEAKAVLDQAREMLSATDRRKSLFNILNNLGLLSLALHEVDEARSFFERAIVLARAQRNPVREVRVLINLAELEFASGATDRAVGRGREAVTLARVQDNRHHLGLALVNLASYLIVQNNPSEARPIAEEALSLTAGEGGAIMRLCLQQRAFLYCLEGRWAEATRLVGFVDHGFSAAGEVRSATDQQVYDGLIGLLRANLSAADIAELVREGARWSEHEVVFLALDDLASRPNKRASS